MDTSAVVLDRRRSPLTRPAPGVLPSVPPDGRSGGGHVRDGIAPGNPSPATVRIVAVLAIVACVEFPLLELVAIAVGPEPGNLVPAALVTAGYLPPFMVIVVATLRGRRVRGAWWYPGAIALVLVVATATIGPQTLLPIFPALAVSAMLLVRPAWALVVLVSLGAATAPLALALAGSVDDFWYPTEVLWLYALVALVAAVRRLEQARRELAERALVRERLRIDDELRSTVGVALADLAERGERITRSSAARTDRTSAELAELVGASRRALADARRIVRGYQRPTLHAELDAAVALLAAAGIPARAEFPDDVSGATAEEAVRRDLQVAIAGLLRDGVAEPVVLRVTGGGPRLVALPDGDGSGAGIPAPPRTRLAR